MARTAQPARKGGRQKGTGNVPPLEKIKANKHKLEKMLLDKALAGDVEAIKACLELVGDEDEDAEETDDG